MKKTRTLGVEEREREKLGKTWAVLEITVVSQRNNRHRHHFILHV